MLVEEGGEYPSLWAPLPCCKDGEPGIVCRCSVVPGTASFEPTVRSSGLVDEEELAALLSDEEDDFRLKDFDSQSKDFFPFNGGGEAGPGPVLPSTFKLPCTVWKLRLSSSTPVLEGLEDAMVRV